MSRHEEKQGCRKLNSICACAFEAILGAYYLDGKFDEIVKFIEKTFQPYIDDVKIILKNSMPKQSFKSSLKDKQKNTPVYTVINESGPQHRKEFEIEVKYNDEVLAVEKGSTKKEAEQKCAYSACKKLGII